MKDLRVAVVGAGNVANGMHMPAWRNIGAEVVAVCDVNKEIAERTAKNWNIPRVYSDFENLLAEEKDALIDLCTPPATHAPLSIRAMDAGHHVILEKPMAMTIEESTKILKEYQERKDRVKLCVIHNYLFSNSMLKIKSVLERMKVEVLGVDIAMLSTPDDEMLSNGGHWVHSLPGGRFGECLIHPVYLMQNLLVNMKVRDVYAAKRGPYDWIDYDELHVTFDSDDGIGSIYISFNSPRQTSFPSMRIYGNNLTLSFDGTNSTLTIQRGLNTESKTKRVKDSLGISMQIMKSTASNVLEVVTGKWRTGHENTFICFAESILENKNLPYTPEEAFEANKVFLEILEKLPKYLPK
jgi:predicted dehydrogenase